MNAERVATKQKHVWGLIRKARATLERAHDLECVYAKNELYPNDRFSKGKYYENDPLGKDLVDVLERLELILA